MAYTVQDDMSLAALTLPQKARAEYLLAINDYSQSGVTPKGYDELVETGVAPKGAPAWLGMFVLSVTRLEMSRRAYEKSKKMNEAKYGSSTRNVHKDAPQGDSTRSVHKETPENKNEKENENETTTTRAHAREGGGGGGCLKSEIRMGSSDGDVYPTPYDALLATYSDKTGSDVGFSRAISVVSSREACSDCPMSKEMVMECAKAAYDAIVDWDREKASTPLGILKAAMRQVDGDA